MKNLFLPFFLIIIPIIFGCAKLELIFSTYQNEIKPGTKKVGLPEDTEFSDENTGIKKEDTIVVSFDSKGFYIGENLYPVEKAGEIISPLVENKPPENHLVYINGESNMPYGEIVKFAKEMRDINLDRIGLIVKTKDKTERKLGVLEVIYPAKPLDTIRKSNPLILILTQTGNGQIKLNGENIGLEGVREKLEQLFKEREKAGVFREGTNEVEKTVFIKSSEAVRYEVRWSNKTGHKTLC